MLLSTNGMHLNLGPVNFWFYKNPLALEGEWEHLWILSPLFNCGAQYTFHQKSEYYQSS